MGFIEYILANWFADSIQTIHVNWGFGLVFQHFVLAQIETFSTQSQISSIQLINVENRVTHMLRSHIDQVDVNVGNPTLDKVDDNCQ